MRAYSFRISALVEKALLLSAIVLFSVGAAMAQAQVSTADLIGSVSDPNGATVSGATVTAKNSANGITRSVTANDGGEYQIIGLPPGDYEITAEAPTFKKTVISPVKLTVGQRAELNINVEIGGQDIIVNVDGGSVELIETGRTNVSNTIDQERIENLPINERSATGFALTLSTVGRDSGRPIGPAPTSGINVGGQRGRSTQINVDGADFTDNSTNASRSTVGQEAVQEFQVATNSYTAEFGRATGGVINVVTKRGGNDLTGNVFGFLRDKEIQARNAFAPADLDKPDFTRGQYGITLGGPIVEDRTFFFAAFEGRQRRESGFFTSNPAQGLTGSITVPAALGGQTYSFLTAQQVQYATALLGASPSTAIAYLTLASSGSRTALFGTNSLVSPGGTFGVPAGQVVGSRFLLSGAPVPIGTVNGNGEPIAFRALNSLQRVFPIRDKTHFFSLRGDHSFNESNQLTARFSYNPGKVSGIQVESQNQSLGQNDFSRTGITDLKDVSLSSGLISNLSGNVLNEFTFSFGRRETSFRSQNNDAVAFNIAGTAFIGRELFSPVERTETRYQVKDNINWVVGNHSLKFGADISTVNIPSALFELNFSGLFNFGNFASTNIAAFPTLGGLAAPDFTPVQSYGLGLPSIFIQGFGNPTSKIKNKPIAFFGQDSWRIGSRLTVNYGVRYDVEFTETIAPVGFRDPLTGITLSAADIQAAQDVIGVQQGIPRDNNNVAPRFGFAYDVFGNSKTVLRGSIGLYYDHPLLALAFNSDIADAAQEQQAVLTPGSPSPTALLNATQVFQGTVCTAAGGNPICPAGVFTPGAAGSAQYQFGRQRFNDQTFTGFGAVLPFTLPIAKDFQYASATQANATIEQQLTKDMSLSVGYIYVGAHHLPRPTDLNTPNTALQVQNFQRFFGGTLPATTQQAVAFSIATTAPGTATGVGCFVVVPGIIASCPGGRVVAPAVANFFRPNAPNYFLAQSLTGGALTKAALDAQLVGSLRTPGTLTPFGSVNAQLSDGNSSYNAMNVELKRRFANNFTFLASYTWSHSIDDSSDLQTLLIPQNVNRFDLEKADSLFDQRHRFVFSGVLASPQGWRTADSWGKKFLADFTIAPIIELSSGRPFNIITNVDTNNDQSTQTDRPNVASDGTLTLPGAFQTGNLGRNRGILGNYASVDLRISRAFYFSEKVKVDLIAEGFNIFNRFNEASASPFFTDVNATGRRDGAGRYFSRSSATYDQRQFQLGLKVSF